MWWNYVIVRRYIFVNIDHTIYIKVIWEFGLSYLLKLKQTKFRSKTYTHTQFVLSRKYHNLDKTVLA